MSAELKAAEKVELKDQKLVGLLAECSVALTASKLVGCLVESKVVLKADSWAGLKVDPSADRTVAHLVERLVE